jgi:hypothetical protein
LAPGYRDHLQLLIMQAAARYVWLETVVGGVDAALVPLDE